MASAEMERFSAIIRERRAAQPASIEERRRQMEEMQRRLRIPADVSSEDVQAGGRPARWVAVPESDDGKVLLYLHGGGYVQGSLDTHHELMGRLARSCRARVLGLDYRLAPEHRFPAAFDDALAAYDWLLGRGLGPGSVMVGGDSAGGGLALAALVAIRDSARPLPAGGVLLSPWTDLTGSGESTRTRADADPMVKAEGLAELAGLYLGDVAPRDPRVSPVFADLAGLPPLLLQVGEAEVLFDDASRVASAVQAAGGTAQLQVWEGAFHVFQSLPQLPEAGEALAAIGKFFARHTGGDA